MPKIINKFYSLKSYGYKKIHILLNENENKK